MCGKPCRALWTHYLNTEVYPTAYQGRCSKPREQRAAPTSLTPWTGFPGYMCGRVLSEESFYSDGCHAQMNWVAFIAIRGMNVCKSRSFHD